MKGFLKFSELSMVGLIVPITIFSFLNILALIFPFFYIFVACFVIEYFFRSLLHGKERQIFEIF